MQGISREESNMPGGIEFATVAESYMALSSDSKLPSVACGSRELESYIAEKCGCQVTGIDSGQEFIAKAKQKTVERNLQDLVTFEIGDGNALAFQSNLFDIVFL
jgi:tocopherol O-methyltransferase